MIEKLIIQNNNDDLIILNTLSMICSFAFEHMLLNGEASSTFFHSYCQLSSEIIFTFVDWYVKSIETGTVKMKGITYS